VTSGLALAILSGAARAAAQAPAAGRFVAYVSTQRVATESVEGKAALAKIRALQEEKTADLRKLQEALTAAQSQLTAADDAQAKALALEVEQQRADLQKATAEAQAEVQTLQRDLSSALTAKMRVVLDDLLKGTDVQLVLQSESAVVWGVPGADLTNAVIERLDATNPDATSTIRSISGPDPT
jgi:Skp family chaperone for outer membrane proteins